jgi:ectoine hydroxylase-related dioxygenase (phytanoyl-CoA dioxygenase family)
MSPAEETGEAAIDAFRRDGFVVVESVFTQGEIDELRAAVTAASCDRLDQPPSMHRRDAYERMFTQHYNLWESSLAVRRYCFDARLARIASRLLGGARLRVFCDQTFVKEHGSTETGLHQDYPLLCIAETTTVNAWIRLDDGHAGGIGYLPGSHRIGPVTNVDLVLGTGLLDNDGGLARFGPARFVPTPAGSVAFHHVLTLHLAAANCSTRDRVAYAVTFTVDDNTRGSAVPHPSLDRAQIKVGEAVAGPAVPMVWPTAGPLPPTPPPMRNAPRGWPGHRPTLTQIGTSQ